MKSIAIVLFAVVAVAYAQNPDVHAEVVRSESVVNPGDYKHEIELSNGIIQKSVGHLKQVGAESALVSKGEFGWASPEGEKIQLSYVADENGYQPTGSHLPVAPEIPVEIVRALKWIAEHPQPVQH